MEDTIKIKEKINQLRQLKSLAWNANDNRKSWYAIGLAISLLEIMLIHNNYGMTSNLPNFPTNQKRKLTVPNIVEDWVSMMDEIVECIIKSYTEHQIEYFATILDSGTDDGGNYTLILFYIKLDSPMDKAANDIKGHLFQEIFENPTKHLLGMIDKEPPYYLAVHTC